MAEYRFYRLNGWGVVDTGGFAKFTDDDTALRHAREMGHPEKVEVWAGARRVGLIFPSAPVRTSERRTG